MVVLENETLSRGTCIGSIFLAGTSKTFGCLKNLVVKVEDFSIDVL